MTTIGQLCLLAAFVASGYAAFACYEGWRRQHRLLRLAGAGAGIIGALATTLVAAILVVALLSKDFRFAYVAEYSNRSLAWPYALSALWVGQAGSLLVWAWFVGLLSMIFHFWPRRAASSLCEPAFAILMAYQCFLLAIMVFGADPTQPSLAVVREGGGLSPELQHPAMLLHPPVVFLGYAACAIPFALAAAALLTGQLDAVWVRQARPWTFFAWAVLGIGILAGAYWAYEELGWGGYWNWDPVENGSLIPWLAVTALIHAAMVYRQRGAMKRTTLLLAVATFAACNFAAFLTRSGIFSSLHEFSQSPIGWMFLLLIAVLTVALPVMLLRRWGATAPEVAISGVWAKESVAAASVFLLVILAAAIFCGTVSLPVSQAFFTHKVAFGAEFYNGVLIPTGLMLLAAMAAAPLLQWGSPPQIRHAKTMAIAAAGAAAAAGGCWLGDLRHPLVMAVAGMAVATAIAIAVSLAPNPLVALRNRRRTYAGYAMHIGLACLAVGVVASSLCSQQRELTLSNGETIHWAGYDIRFARLLQERLPEKLVVQAELEVAAAGAAVCTLLPAQEYYFLQSQWSGKVAIHSAWSGDLYTILHSGQGQDRIRLTLVSNPMMRWMWLSGWIVLLGAVPWFWPAGKGIAISVQQPRRVRETHHREFDAAAAIRASQLWKSFGGRPVLAGLDLEIAVGQCVALFGANGAGKTTLLNCLASAMRPDSGEVIWFGQPVGRNAELRRWIGRVAHESGLYPHLSLRENLLFAARINGVGQAGRCADRWLEVAGLSPYADHLPTRISRGMRQRLVMVRALVHDPRLLLLDEPLTGLDERGAEWLLRLLTDLRDRGRTICFVTHDRETAGRLAHRILELREGKVYDVTGGKCDCRPVARAA